ncbi:nuclear transport factor 2 family protein [Novosphingobium sp. FSY-8]|uniref:Nuclear transport factor 2 family protein n=1 Tax=Novosphingobium ovatum TaxID=1908523 RepID=A0ABW9XGW3_9SPHN|nr:nuclear transport factor 2 family protein [Novosphingobium ovatum]NBC37790.1 nuclear transport factor 2 family protein [Novosphingobium ovatum]
MDKIEALIARDEIRALSGAYMRGLDRRDADLMKGVFWPDSTTDYGFYQGPGAEFVDFAQTMLADHQANLHMLGQINIDLDGPRAFGEVYYFAWHRVEDDGVPTDLIIAGRYVDRYEQRDGVWKIAHRSELIDWVRSDPASEHYLARIPGALLGGHGAADRSSQRDWLATA